MSTIDELPENEGNRNLPSDFEASELQNPGRVNVTYRYEASGIYCRESVDVSDFNSIILPALKEGSISELKINHVFE